MPVRRAIHKNSTGFTLIEIVIVVLIISLILFISVPSYNRAYSRIILKSTANEVRDACKLAQQLSIDESREFRVEFINDIYRVRENRIDGREILRRQLQGGIYRISQCDSGITYNRDGNTTFGKFILSNNYGDRIEIQILLGTGKVNVNWLN